MTDERQMDTGESEDLFNFTEIYTAPVNTTQSAAEAPEPDEDAPTFDETDCLFNFDELGAEADTVSVDAAAIMASVPDAPSSAASAPEPVAAATEQAPVSGAPIETAASAPSPEAVPVQQQVLVAAPRSMSMRSPIVLVLLVSMLINLGVIGFTWRVSGKMHDEFGEATRTIIQATQEIQTKTEANVAKLESFQSPVISEDPEHEHTFERVRLDIENRDFASARKRLYALLSIADRLDPDIREKVEATAQFVLADTALQIALTSEGEEL